MFFKNKSARAGVWMKVLISSAWSSGIIAFTFDSRNLQIRLPCPSVLLLKCAPHWRFDKTCRCGFEFRIFAVVSLSSSSFLGLMHSRDEAKTDKLSSDMGLLLWGEKKIKKEDYEFWIICMLQLQCCASSPLVCFRW